jgi:hypothetical protein
MIQAAAVLLAVVAPAAVQAPAGGSEPAPMVRVQLRNEDVVQGFLRGNSKDEVVIFTSERRYRHVPLSEVQRFEVRRRTGSHARRGAMMGVFLWASLMFAASIDRLEEAGAASWESGAILAGSVALGAAAGKGVPRYGWAATEPQRLRPAVQLSFRF